MKALWPVATGLLNVALVLLAAPLFEGVLRRLTARLQARQGPPLLQPWFDLLKLLGKEDLESGETPWMQRAAAMLALAAVLTVAWLIPMGAGIPLNGSADIVLLIYLLGLCAISTLFAGLAAGSTYSLVGMSREMMAVITLEPLFVVALLVGATHTGSFRLDAVLAGSVYATDGFPWSGVLMLVLMLLSFQAFVQRAPFDTTEAETEIMEGPLIEYSGPKLALLKAAHMARLVIHAALFVALFLPWGNHLPPPLGWLVCWAKVAGLVLLVGLVAATHARYRIDQVLRYYTGLLLVSILALVLAATGH